MAARQPFLSVPFCFCYGLVLVIMVGYAFVWQQVLHSMPLTVAYANPVSLLIWGMLWGATLSGKDHLEYDSWGSSDFFGICLVVTAMSDSLGFSGRFCFFPCLFRQCPRLF